jgi:sulfite reductase alpha subunit
MAKKLHNTPNLDELEKGEWPSFVTGLKRLAKDKDIMVVLLACSVMAAPLSLALPS